MESVSLDQWQIEYDSGIPVYRQIINHVYAAVAAGGFKAGDQLPTIRALQERLQVNPNTVAKAYRELELKGIIVSERGSGSFIKEQPAPSPAAEPQPAAEKTDRLKTIYNRLLTEAAISGLTEGELLSFIKEKKPTTL